MGKNLNSLYLLVEDLCNRVKVLENGFKEREERKRRKVTEKGVSPEKVLADKRKEYRGPARKGRKVT